MSKYQRFKTHIAQQKDAKNLPAEYIQDHMEDEDLNSAIITPPLKYAARINSFTTLETIDDLESEEESLFTGAKEELLLLKQAIIKYRQKTNPEFKQITVYDEPTVSWKEVKETIIQAKACENGQDNESWSARAHCDKIVDNISVLEAWLGLLPDGDYGAVVGGVFKMIVGAAKRAQEVRVTVLKALADIPYWVRRATRYRNLYADSKPYELVHMTAQLCSAILVALRHVIIYFTEGVLKKAWKAVAQGLDYKQSLLGHLDRVRELVEKVDQEAAVSQQYRIQDLERLCERSFQDITAQLNGVKEQQKSKTFRMDAGTRQSIQKDIRDALNEHLINSLYSQLSSNPIVDSRLREISPRIMEAPPSASLITSHTPEGSIVNREILLSALGCPQELPRRDLERCLHMGLSIGLSNQDRVKWMIQSRRLQDWLNSSESCTLLLNGNGDATDTFSPTTFLAAKLLDGLTHIEPIISLRYFCSLHMSSREGSKEDATSLLKSLISQLLLLDTPYELNFISKADLEKIEHDDFPTLCSLFRKLIQHLPSPTFLFWIIDGINFYERSERRRDFLDVVKLLLERVQESKEIVIKLLLTCHGKSSYVKNLVGKEDILTVPTVVDGSRQGWSEAAFRRTLGRELEKLENVERDGESAK